MLNNQHYGVEIEFTGIVRERAAKVIADALGSVAQFIGGAYDEWLIVDGNGKKWKVMRDVSIRSEYWSRDNRRYQGYADRSAGKQYKNELVSPVLGWGDFDALEKILAALGKTKAKVNNSCGLHVHVDGVDHTAGSLKNLVGLWVNKEEMLYQALEVDFGRIDYAKKYQVGMNGYYGSDTKRFYELIMKEKYSSKDAVGAAYYESHHRTFSERNTHYSNTRYYGLNLHSLWQKGTVEFRLFNSTLDFETAKAYIVMSMAINERALSGKGLSLKSGSGKMAREVMVWWLERLGLRGKEFAGVRKVLAAKLPKLADVA